MHISDLWLNCEINLPPIWYKLRLIFASKIPCSLWLNLGWTSRAMISRYSFFFLIEIFKNNFQINYSCRSSWSKNIDGNVTKRRLKPVARNLSISLSTFSLAIWLSSKRYRSINSLNLINSLNSLIFFFFNKLLLFIYLM